jgi:hypothetical protein
MTLAQSFLLGVMVAWTPSLVFLAYRLRPRNILYDERDAVLPTK